MTYVVTVDSQKIEDGVKLQIQTAAQFGREARAVRKQAVPERLELLHVRLPTVRQYRLELLATLIVEPLRERPANIKARITVTAGKLWYNAPVFLTEELAGLFIP